MLGNGYRAFAALAVLGLAACGVSSNGDTPPGATATPTPMSGTPTTPSATPARSASPTPNGTPSVLPPIVNTGRVVFRSQTGETCCVAADPDLLPPMPKPGQTVLVLDDLPSGPATVTVAGFVEDFAPAPPDVLTTCKTLNTTGVKPCDPTRNASPAFESDPKMVTIFSGVRVNLGDVDVVAVPFVLEGFTPPQNAEVPLPVDFAFTVGDAQTGVAQPSVALDITLDVPQGEPPVFRSLTKRVPLQLTACRDGSGHPCSPESRLDVSGFQAKAVAEYLSYLPAGPVAARITAQNNADPPRDLDFRYTFLVAPDASATATPTANSVGAAGLADALMVPTPTPTSTPQVP